MTTFTDTVTLITAAFMNTVALVVEDPAVAALTSVTAAADTFPYYTSGTVAAAASITSFGRSFVANAGASGGRATLGLGTVATHAHTEYATAAQGALADTALQPTSPAILTSMTVATDAFVVRSDGNSGFGYAGEPEIFTTHRRYVSLMGMGTGTSDGSAMIQWRSNAAEGLNNLGGCEWIDANNNSGNTRSAQIVCIIEGATANNRGARLSFNVRPDSGSVVVEKMRISNDGSISFGCTDAGTGDQYKFGDANRACIVRLRGDNGGGNRVASIKLSRASTLDWVITHTDQAAVRYFVIGYNPASDTDANHEASAALSISAAKNVGIGQLPQANARLLVSANTSSSTAPFANTVAHFVGVDAASAQIMCLASYGGAGHFITRRANGTAASPTKVLLDDNIGAFAARGFQETTSAFSTANIATMHMCAAEDFTSTAMGTYIQFKTTPTGSVTQAEVLRLGPDGALTIANKIKSYNGVACVAGGVGQIVASSRLNTQSAAIAATTIYAVPASGAGWYRVTWCAAVTTAATTSSTVGAVAVIYTDPVDSVVKTTNTGSFNSNAGNTTGSAASGVHVAYCKASTNLQYSCGYASVGGTSMVYDLNILVEYLGA